MKWLRRFFQRKPASPAPEQSDPKHPEAPSQCLDEVSSGAMQQDQAGEFDSLVAELLQIGASTEMEEGRSHFFVPKGEGVGPYQFWHPRVREIGARLHQKGYGTLELMRTAHQIVAENMGANAASDLSANWHMIGWDGTDEEFHDAGAAQVLIMMGKTVDPSLVKKVSQTWQH